MAGGSEMWPLVLVHGGGFAGSCWDLVVDALTGPVLAVDLPGRGEHPAPLESVSIGSAAASVVADIDAAGFDEVVLVGHSLAGCSMPATIGLLGDRVRRAVFVACTVPEHDTSCFDTLSSDVQAMAQARRGEGPGVLDPTTARPSSVTISTTSSSHGAWCAWFPRRRCSRWSASTYLRSARPRPAPGYARCAMRLSTRTSNCAFARNLGHCDVIDLDAGHMCMISKPGELAAILNDVAPIP